MKTYRPHKLEGIHVINFPDGQPHVRLTAIPEPNEEVAVVCPIRNPNELFLLQLTMNAIAHSGADVSSLTIPYLMGARYDRIMQLGDSFDLSLVASIINTFDADAVHLFDVHSSVATEFINNSKSHRNDLLLKRYNQLTGGGSVTLIVPDKGASARVEGYRKILNVNQEVYCDKERDANGKITLSVRNPQVCAGRRCVVVDDLCDGGGTFIAISDQVRPYAPAYMTLIVSHGIFSRGLDPLTDRFDLIITSDSYADMKTGGKLNVVNLNL